ncbi:glutamate racemase [Weissella uvarum]|uniref:glutamate racemase n=1 Tax=Weissella uvarum TaxID=1479233 RepID=UPI00195F740C|nr:glutamate racemase [Weissella uvarum]MBM7617585.1 glutamate racemase [Weissella uvarum]MCM0595533.1 glutamate racemase [Weissella uvarum]
MDNRAIGYMDSGVGGLTAVKQALYQLPNEQVKYVGDTLRMPYGPRRTEEVAKFSLQIGHYLNETADGIKLLVIACNTATAAALPLLQEHLPIPVVGVIQPGVEAALNATDNNVVGVIATQGTVDSNAYYNGLMAGNPGIDVHQLATPDLVTLVESNEQDHDKKLAIVREQLAGLAGSGIDTLILGCTHFPLLMDEIQEVVGDEVTLVNAGAEAINLVEQILDDSDARHGIYPMSNHEVDQYYTTGSVDTFGEIATRWLDIPVSVKHLKTDANDLTLIEGE